MDRVDFRFSDLDGEQAYMQWCIVYRGKSYCADFGTVSFPSLESLQIISSMGLDDDSGHLICSISWDEQTIYSGYTYEKYAPALGSIGYFVNSTGELRPLLTSFNLATATTLTVSLQDCIDDAEWERRFFDLTGADPATTKVQLRGSGQNANCKAAGKALVSGFSFVVTSLSVSAQSIASTFVNSVGTPAGAAAGVTSAGVVSGSQGAILAGLPGSVGSLPGTAVSVGSVAAGGGGGGGGAAGLSGGSIAGIVIGSVAGGIIVISITALIIAAVVVAAVVIAKNNNSASAGPTSAAERPKRGVRGTIVGLFGGVDVMNDPVKKSHQSITARSPGM